MSRVLPGICLALGWLLILFLGPFELFWLVLVAGACVALHEYFRMAMPPLQGWRLFITIGCCLLPILAAVFGRDDVVLAGVFCSLLGLVGMALHGYGVMSDVFRYACTSGFASIYIAFCAAHMVLIRALPQGAFWLTLLVGIVAGSDTGAYYAGRAFGQRKLFPLISPKKTVAGGFGGLLAGIAAAEAINLFFPQPANPLLLLPVAIGLVLVGIAGDLAESMIKRSVGVKDSGTILMGHGGVLDRIDSLLLTAPVLYYLLHFRLL